MRFSRSPLGGAITVTTNVFSAEILLDQHYGYAFQAIWSGTLVGLLKVQTTIDGQTWSDMYGSDWDVATGDGSFLWNNDAAFYYKARLHFVWTSGAGEITFWATTKGP